MSSFFIPTGGPIGWKALLAEPDKHWKDGRSAKLLAERWEDASGFPIEIRSALESAGIPALRSLDFVVGFPESKTPLPGGSRPSQTDLLVLGRGSDGGLIVIGIEGKVDEPFGPTIDDWSPDASPGKRRRLDYLAGRLGLDAFSVGHLRYQLFHRTVAAMLEAERFGARHAVMLVHSFDPDRAGYADFSKFVEACGGDPTTIALLRSPDTPVIVGWVAAETEG